MIKKLIISLILLFLTFFGFSQGVIQRASPTNTVADGRLMANFNLFVPIYSDTVAANTQKGIDTSGAIFYDRSINGFRIRKCCPKRWDYVTDSTMFATITALKDSGINIRIALVDSTIALKSLINAKGTGSVDTVKTGFGLGGGTITVVGTLFVDTTKVPTTTALKDTALAIRSLVGAVPTLAQVLTAGNNAGGNSVANIGQIFANQIFQNNGIEGMIDGQISIYKTGQGGAANLREDSVNTNQIYQFPNASGNIPLTVNGVGASATTGNITIPIGLANINGLIAGGTNIALSGSGTTGSPYVINSTAPGTGTVTSITAGAALTGGTISTSGTIGADTSVLVTTTALKDSLNNYVKAPIPNSSLQHSAVFLVPSNGVIVGSSNTLTLGNTVSIGLDTTKVPTSLSLQDTAAALRAAIAGAGSGTVTSIATSTGILGGTITTTGTLKADTSLLATKYKVQQDSIALATRPVGTDTTINITNVTPSITGKVKTFTIPYSAITGNKIFAGTNITVSHNPDSSYTVNSTASGGNIYAGTGLLKASDSAHLYTDSLVVPQITDIPNLPQIKQWVVGKGVYGADTLLHYPAQFIDSVNYLFSTVPLANDYGGCLNNSTSGDSIRVNTPIGVMIGNSIVAGHPALFSGLEKFNIDRPDSFGQMTYTLSALTSFEWKNRGWGGQTTQQIRARFLRDAIGLSSNVNDGDGSTTLGHTPSIVIIEGGVNDYSGGLPIAQTEANIEWMAAACAQYSIPCVFLNLPGDAFQAIPAEAGYGQFVSALNIWLASGILNKYNCSVFDLNSMWNSGVYGGVSAYNNDNVHFSSLVNSGDGIHFTKIGYDSLAKMIFKVCKLPVLTKMLYVSGVNPSSPIANYNRPTSIQITGYQGAQATYALPNSIFDTIPVTSQMSDSMSIKTLASTNVVGSSTVSGFSTIKFFLDNNPLNQLWYTRKNNIISSAETDLSATSLTITAPSITNYQPARILYANPSGVSPQEAYRVNLSASTASFLFNNLTTTTGIIPTGLGTPCTLSAFGTAGIGTHGPFFTDATNSVIGLIQLGYNSASAPSAIGRGIGQGVNGINIDGGGVSAGSLTTPLLQVRNYTTAIPNVGTSTINNSYLNLPVGIGNVAALRDTITTVGAPLITINNTTQTYQSFFGYSHWNTVVTSRAGLGLNYLWANNGNVWVNTSSGRASIGVTDANIATQDQSAKLAIEDTVRGFKPPSMTTTQRNKIGYLQIASFTSGSYTVAPTATITGSNGSELLAVQYIGGTSLGAQLTEAGYGYGGASTPTVAFSGGTGSGAAMTLSIHAADSGLIIFNTTVDSLQMYNGASWVNLGFSSSPTFTKINITTGSNATIGTSTLSGGTVTVSTTAVTASSKIFLTDATTGALTNIGTPTVGTVTAGTSFVINSSNVLDTSNINWIIFN